MNYSFDLVKTEKKLKSGKLSDLPKVIQCIGLRAGAGTRISGSQASFISTVPCADSVKWRCLLTFERSKEFNT